MTKSANPKVYIIDDQPLMSHGIAAVLAAEGFEVLGMSTDGNEGIAQCTTLKPNVCVIDTSLSGLAARLITQDLVAQGVHVVGVADVPDTANLQSVLEAGGIALVLKSEPISVLSAATRAAVEGTQFLSEPVERLLALNDPELPSATSPVRSLTPRELEVLKLFADGNSTSEIATRLSLSVKTVETHRKNVMDKLQTRSIAQLTKLAIQAGISSLAH